MRCVLEHEETFLFDFALLEFYLLDTFLLILTSCGRGLRSGLRLEGDVLRFSRLKSP